MVDADLIARLAALEALTSTLLCMTARQQYAAEPIEFLRSLRIYIEAGMGDGGNHAATEVEACRDALRALFGDAIAMAIAARQWDRVAGVEAGNA